MKVTVSLYGTWYQRFPEYRPSQGIEVEMVEGATVKDLLAHLSIPELQGAVVIAGGCVLRAGDEILPGTAVSVMQAVGGG